MVDRTVIDGLVSKIFSPSVESISIVGGSKIDNVAWHDFTEYLYIRDPEYSEASGSSSNLPSFVESSDTSPFEYFKPRTWNIGLRLVYRQEWRPLGNQRGEIIKTIPLGPKQIEKVSSKIIRKTKVTKTAETLKSVETSTETADTSKDSSEIVSEASSTFGWNVEAEASVNVGFASGKISTGMQSNSENKSRETNSKLSESMQKTASKMKTETKIVVSTESESTFELATASEIQNPNEEIPITYVYSNLQRQYEILTQMAEVHNVVMVAEQVPLLTDIDYRWIRKHDWIISKVLLDDSFRDTLNNISQGIHPEQPSSEKKQTMSLTLSQAFTHLGAYASGTASISNIDIVKQAQESYQNAVSDYEMSVIQFNEQSKKLNRLLDHIKDNILHYCRAIWSNEDHQQRMLRYRRMDTQVPTEWVFVKSGETGPITMTLEELSAEIIASETAPGGQTTFELEGDFVPVEGSEVNLAEIINPSGPIGYYGNYAIYYMRPEYTGADIFDMLQILKTPYLYYEDALSVPVLMDPLLKLHTINSFEEEPIIHYDSLTKKVKIEMVDFIPELRLLYVMLREDYPLIDDFVEIDDEDLKELFVEKYPEYLFRLDLTRRFVLDTNNIILDIEPGMGTALEPFKLAHRGIDVLKEIEVKEKLRLFNQRYRKLLQQGLLEGSYWTEADTSEGTEPTT